MLKATNRKLTGSEKRQIKAVIRRARSGHGNRVSAQQTIPYQRMYPDGVCRVDVNRYNKTIQFQDINYQLSENEDKDAIFGSWCEFINYFDSSVSFEFSFLNLENGQSGGDDRIEMTARQDDFDGIREEYAQMLQNQLARGNNGLRKTKYLTFTIEADNTEGTLQVNSYVDYNLTASQSDNCLVLPIQAVRTVGLEDGTSATVVYLKADSMPDNAIELPYSDETIPEGFYPVQVEIGIQDNNNVEIKSGVEEGTVVFTQIMSDNVWG